MNPDSAPRATLPNEEASDQGAEWLQGGPDVSRCERLHESPALLGVTRDVSARHGEHPGSEREIHGEAPENAEPDRGGFFVLTDADREAWRLGLSPPEIRRASEEPGWMALLALLLLTLGCLCACGSSPLLHALARVEQPQMTPDQEWVDACVAYCETRSRVLFGEDPPPPGVLHERWMDVLAARECLEEGR